jgi:biotin carboxyl carrier protein
VRYDIEVNGKRRQVTVDRKDSQLTVSSGGRTWIVDAAHAGSHTLSLLVEQVRVEPGTPGATTGADAAPGSSGPARVESDEVSIATDPIGGQFVFGIRGVRVVAGLSARRRWGSTDDGSAVSGPQRILAPMPGKVVRVLARPGDSVQHRQAIVVIEAMKMENELRAERDGTLAELLVQEGQSVDAGALLAVVSPR